jgi:signal transduction histidine kinase
VGSPSSPIVRVLAFSRETAALIESLASQARLEAIVHVCVGSLADAVANARAATPEAGILAVVDGKNAVVSALGAGVDEAIEAHILTSELLALAAELADERRKSRRERDALQRSLAENAKLAALGTVVAGVVHEVSNPATMINLQLGHLSHMLQGLRASLGAIERSAATLAEAERAEIARALAGARTAIGDDQAEQAIRDCEVGMRMITDVIRDLRVLSHGDRETPPEIVDLRKLVDQVVRLSGIESDHRVHIERDFPDDMPLLWLPRSRVLQIFANLVANAIHAMQRNTSSLRRLRVIVRSDETTLMIAFNDTGAGISPAQLGRVFEPFFTTKGPEHGTGLGLYMSSEIVRKLGGDLTLDSVEGRGTTAMVFLPIALKTASAPEQGDRRKKRARVLVAASSLEQLHLVRRHLLGRYDLLLARDAIEALDLLDSGAQVDLVLCGRDEPAIDREPLRLRIARSFPALARRTVILEDLSRFDREALEEAVDRRLGTHVEAAHSESSPS